MRIVYEKDDVRVVIDGDNGFFEIGSTEYDYIEGELIFEDKELVDFDGCFVLPFEVAIGIRELQYIVDIEHFCE